MKATEKTFNGLRISGFLALFLILALSGLSCYLIAGINETWSVITGPDHNRIADLIVNLDRRDI